jgi:hypothetical protein
MLSKSSSNKIIAGTIMIVPAFAYHVYWDRRIIYNNEKNLKEDESWTSTTKRVANTWFQAAGFTTIVGTAYIGALHVAMGCWQLSPTICPRK